MSSGKAAFHHVLHSSGLTRLWYAASHRQKVLSYHNVLHDGLIKNVPSDGLTVSASVLRQHLLAASRFRRFTTVLGEPDTVMVTFDDGNLNNFECAEPVLSQLGIKAYFFVPLDTALNGAVAWPDLIAHWCEYSQGGLPPPVGLDGARIEGSSSSRSKAAKILSAAANGNASIQRAIRDHVKRWQDSAEVSEYSRLRFSAMSRTQIEALKEKGHLVGAHSLFHDVLSTIPRDGLRDDMEACAAAIGDVYNTDIYCYPFGGPNEVNSDVAEACRRAGFTAAFVNVPNPWAHTWGDFALPRVTLLEQHGPSSVHARISGVEDHIKRLIRRSPSNAKTKAIH